MGGGSVAEVGRRSLQRKRKGEARNRVVQLLLLSLDAKQDAGRKYWSSTSVFEPLSHVDYILFLKRHRANEAVELENAPTRCVRVSATVIFVIPRRLVTSILAKRWL